jgi:hypothetical protein
MEVRATSKIDKRFEGLLTRDVDRPCLSGLAVRRAYLYVAKIRGTRTLNSTQFHYRRASADRLDTLGRASGSVTIESATWSLALIEKVCEFFPL